MMGIGWQIQIDNKWLNTNACNKHLGILEDDTWSMNQQFTTAAERADAILGCIHRGVMLRSWEVIVLLYASVIQVTSGILYPGLVITV